MGSIARVTLAATLLLAALPLTAADSAARSPALAEINEALEGRRATLDFVDGGRITGARRVVVDPAVTTWRHEGAEGEIATGEVARITIERRSPLLRAMRRGALIGAGVGLVGVGWSERGGWSVEVPGNPAGIGASALLGAAIGAAVGASRGPELPEVVYERD